MTNNSIQQEEEKPLLQRATEFLEYLNKEWTDERLLIKPEKNKTEDQNNIEEEEKPLLQQATEFLEYLNKEWPDERLVIKPKRTNRNKLPYENQD